MSYLITMKWFAEAPSNIALIKYMGRKDEEAKIPANASLSYTLPNLKSFVELELCADNTEKFSRWEPLVREDGMPITLSMQAQQRFLTHLRFILNYFSYRGTFIVRSCNNFPQATGLASSASSFAALTLAVVQAVCELTQQLKPSLDTIAQLSRHGSGSSCRSLYAPWALWEDETVQAIEVPSSYQNLIHQAIIISREEKKVPSSEAHQRVKTSDFYPGRALRAEENLNRLLTAFKKESWGDAFCTVWDDFQDMHNLFETSSPAFSYKNEASEKLLHELENYWIKNGDGPLITMDAGPNIHLLYRADQMDILQKIQQDYLKGHEYAPIFCT